VFSKYISNVLPELGEENTMQSTFTSFAESYLKEFKEVESFTTFVERYYKDPNFDPELKRLIDFKQSDDLKFLLDAFIEDYRSRIKVMGGIQIGQRVYTKEHLDSRLQYGPSKMGILDRIDQIAENICEELRIPISKYKSKIKKLIISKIRMPLDMKQIYQLFLNGLNNTTDMEIPKISKSKLSYEDLLPYLYIKFELFGYPKNNGIRHVIIDEAQDYTRLQFAMLAKIFESSSFTILKQNSKLSSFSLALRSISLKN
jgi:DNA helicase-2/ATP-dependent DNA helicase PcrA